MNNKKGKEGKQSFAPSESEVSQNWYPSTAHPRTRGLLNPLDGLIGQFLPLSYL